MIVSISFMILLHSEINVLMLLDYFLCKNLPVHNEFDDDDEDDIEIANYLSRNKVSERA